MYVHMYNSMLYLKLKDDESVFLLESFETRTTLVNFWAAGEFSLAAPTISLFLHAL